MSCRGRVILGCLRVLEEKFSDTPAHYCLNSSLPSFIQARRAPNQARILTREPDAPRVSWNKQGIIGRVTVDAFTRISKCVFGVARRYTGNSSFYMYF